MSSSDASRAPGVAAAPRAALPKVATLVVVVMCLLGLTISVIQTWEHLGYCANPSAFEGAVCGPKSGCGASFWSPLSELPFGHCAGIPISILGSAFYVVFLALTVVRARSAAATARDQVIRRIQFGLGLAAVVYSIALGAYSLMPKLDPSGVEVSGLCLLCTVLYGVNLVLLVTSLITRGEPLGAHVRGAFGAAWSRVAAATLVAFVAIGGIGFWVYHSTLVHERAVIAAAKADAEPEAPLTFDISGRPTVGPEKARLQIVEFADFQCPHCRLLFHTLEGFRAAHPNDVRLTFFSFPLDQACNRMIDRPFHDRACELARLAECAHRQGHFYEAAKILFDDAASPTAELVTKLVTVGLDAGPLEACAAAGTAAGTAEAHVKADIEAGLAVKIEGTPAVFANGKLVGGARDRDFFEALLEKKTQAGN